MFPIWQIVPIFAISGGDFCAFSPKLKQIFNNQYIMKNKLFYTQPNTELLELRSEGIICNSIILNFDDDSNTEVLIGGADEDF